METSTRDSALTITVLSAGAYACAYAYEAGYLGHFGLPAEFVEVNLRGVMLSAVALLTTGAAGFALGLLGGLPATSPTPLRNLVIRTAAVYAVSGAMAYVLSLTLREAMPTLMAVTVFLLVDWLLPAIKYRGQAMTFSEKIAAHRASEPRTYLDAVGAKARQPLSRILLLAGLGALVSWWIGGVVAKRQIEYLMSKDCVALRIEDKTLLCARWDGALTGEYEYRAAEGIVLSMDSVGPLPRYRHRQLRPVAQRQADASQGEPLADAPVVDAPVVDAPDAASNTQADTPTK